MPRNQNAGNLALRNRNRVTNKTRLKVIKGNIDADPIVLDEDEERARVVSTAGVDAEDANEHHLQAVLSAASHRATTHAQRVARGATEKTEKKNESTTLIPVPDAAGVVENYVESYPANRWVTPVSYVKFSDVVEECITTAIADGFTYFMDERDVEWLEKNNQDARGEGPSTQPSNASGTTTRSGGHRSAKSKGKEPEVHQAVHMSEDNFELVMGLFEKIAHDNTPFLHLSLHQAAEFPPFSDYQEVFGNELSPSYFATHLRPANIPSPATLVKMARAVYPYWRVRKQEREGHRIIPALNFDESDAKNESYICFRRREIKAVRKTRAAQVSSSEKLIRLKSELNTAFELSRLVLHRETMKREAANQQRLVWERRLVVADFKRQSALFGTREDEELLVDRERVLKRPRPSDASATQPKWAQKSRPSAEVSSSPAPHEPLVRPRERTNKILNTIEENIKRQKERDTHWDDQIDSPYQPTPLPYGERMFKDLSKPQDPLALPPAERQETVRVLFRARTGRGGFRFVDRRHTTSHAREYDSQLLRNIYRTRKESENPGELTDQLARISERFRYDEPNSLESSVDEEDRILVDDFDTKYLRHSMSLLHDSDHGQLVEMRSRAHDASSAHRSRDSTSAAQGQVASPAQSTHASVSTTRVNGVMPTAVGLPVSVQTPVRQTSQPTASQPIRVPSNGPHRPPSATSPTSSAAPSSSPIHRPASVIMAAANGVPAQNAVNGMAHNATNGGQSITLSLPNGGQTFPNGVKSPSESRSSNQVPVTTPPRPMSQNQMHAAQQQVANGLAGLPNYPGVNFPLQSHQMRSARNLFDGDTKQLLQQQQQSMIQQQLAHQQRLNLSNYPHVMNAGMNGANLNNMPPSVGLNLKMPANRQVAWQRQQQQQQQQHEMMQGLHAAQLQQLANMNGAAAQIGTLNGHVSPSRPSQSPSNNIMLSQNPDSKSPTLQHLQHAHSPHLGSPTPAHLSPPRNMQTPIPNSSPLPQHQHIANGATHGQAY